MANTVNLASKYSRRASGVYREIIDETSTSLATSNTNVVVVLQSEQGPIMKPIYCEDQDTLHAVFGTRNAKLEAKGNFGILMAEHVLEAGPVWILNVKNIDANTETVDVVKLACNNADTESFSKEAINTVYDTTKFWNVDPMYGTHGDDAMLTFASVANGTATVVVTKYDDKDNDYNYTIKQVKQFNPEFLADGLDDDAYVSDYLVQVDIFKTDLLSANISTVGAIVDGKVNLAKLAELRADSNAKFFKTYVGAVGNVIDASGNKLSIVSQINADYLRHGIWCAQNVDDIAANGIDLLGITAIEFGEGATDTACKQIKRLGETFTPALTAMSADFDAAKPNVAIFKNTAPKKGAVVATDYAFARVADSKYVGDSYVLDPSVEAAFGTLQAPIQTNGKPFQQQNGVFVYPATYPTAKAGQALEVRNDNILYFYEEFVEQLASWEIDFSDPSISTNAVTLNLVFASNGEDRTVSTSLSPDMTTIASTLQASLNAAITDATFTVASSAEDVLTISVGSVNQGVADLHLTSAVVVDDEDAQHSVSFESAIASNVLTLKSEEIIVIGSTVSTSKTGTADLDMSAIAEAYGVATKNFEVTFDRPLQFGATVPATATLYLLEPWYASTTSVNAHVATGIRSLESHYVNGTAARQERILDMLNTDGIMNAFADKTVFKCRYMVDSFKTYIAPNQKVQYAKLAASSCRFLAFIPAPFFYELRTSKNPTFYDLLGNFKMSYVKLGYNPDVPSTNSFGYTTDTDGAKFLVPVMNVMHNDGFADKVVPATGMLAKYFYIKHIGAHKVYDIVAGQDWPMSAAGVVGPEFTAAEPDRAAMEQMGTNVLQVIDGVLQLRSNRTAFQSIQSAANHPETIEKAFYVQDFVEPTLDGRLFKYNNEDARLQVKLKADEACDQMVADGAISAYVNICDLTNNPVDVRKSGIIVLDTELYNEYGIRIAVHRVTIKNANN